MVPLLILFASNCLYIVSWPATTEFCISHEESINQCGTWLYRMAIRVEKAIYVDTHTHKVCLICFSRTCVRSTIYDSNSLLIPGSSKRHFI